MARIVLIADDSPTIQKRAVGILKGDGYEVETVSNGVAAIKRLSTLRPTVILADVCMPGRDGYEVCEHVKKSPEYSHIPVVLIASDMEPYDSAKGTAVMADGILKKPFEGRELLALVGKLADEFEAAVLAIPEPPTAPVAAPSVEEFEMSPEPDMTPTIVQPAEADFAGNSSGVAFAELAEVEEPAFPQASHASIGEFPFGAKPIETAPVHENDIEFPTLQAEEPAFPLDSHPGPALDIEAHPAHTEDATASFFEGMSTPSIAIPVFIEEHSASTPSVENHSAAMSTAIFRAPIEIAQPVWNDETLHATSEAESASAVALEPQFITEENDVSVGHSHDHSHPHSHDHADDDGHEHLHDHSHATNATNLGSFSLDDAAAGQVRFASEIPEVVYADESAEASALAAPAPEATEQGDQPLIPEVIYADPASEELALEQASAEAAAPKPESNEPIAEATEHIEPAESGAEVVYSDDALPMEPVAPVEPLAEESHEESSAIESAAGASEVEVVSAPEEEKPEAAPAEFAHTETEPDPAVEEPSPIEEAQAEPVVEHSPEPIAAEEAAPPAIPEPAAAPLPLKPAVDHDLVYSIVHKVVAHMSPSFLGDEAKADMAKRLAEQIAAELSTDSSAHS